MLASGVSVKVVQEMLGHSSPAITLAIYAHTTPSMAREAGEALSSLSLGEGLPEPLGGIPEDIHDAPFRCHVELSAVSRRSTAFSTLSMKLIASWTATIV